MVPSPAGSGGRTSIIEYESPTKRMPASETEVTRLSEDVRGRLGSVTESPWFEHRRGPTWQLG